MLTKEITYEQAIAWWNNKTDEQKFRTVGVEVIDKWVRDTIAEEFLAIPAPISVTKLLSK